ncbi:MAG: hypothetical protein V2J26_12030 [Pacificimonas sp.]|jgi:hypothetical protein|nr:hypothetical protein [Pacificimonas sp.]
MTTPVFLPQSGPPLCILAAAGERWTARMRGLSAVGALIETNGRPPLGALAALAHPGAGGIIGRVQGHRPDGVALAFDVTDQSSAFALAVNASDMGAAARSARN